LLASFHRAVAFLSAKANDHDTPLVHCDIKPDNILVSGKSPPTVKLADLGVAIPYKDGFNRESLRYNSVATRPTWIKEDDCYSESAIEGPGAKLITLDAYCVGVSLLKLASLDTDSEDTPLRRSEDLDVVEDKYGLEVRGLFEVCVSTNDYSKQLAATKMCKRFNSIRQQMFPDESSLVVNGQPEGQERQSKRIKPAYQDYMCVCVVPPCVVSGHMSCLHNYLDNIVDMQCRLELRFQSWKRSKQFPVRFLEGTANSIEELPKEQTYSIVWSSAGFDCRTRRSSNKLSPALFKELISGRRPQTVIVCMEYGAKATASTLLESGIPCAVWIKAQLLDQVLLLFTADVSVFFGSLGF
jgi:serine/threonine protein kinase